MKSRLASRWAATVLICGKCSRRVGGGFGEERRDKLAKVLKRRFGGGKGRRAPIGIVETRCLGVCPKNAVLAIEAGRPDVWHLIRPGTSVDEIVHVLKLPPPEE